MATADHRGRWRLRTPLALAAGAVALFLAALGGSSDAAAQSTPPPFAPGASTCLETTGSGFECDGDPSPGAAASIRSRFCVGWNDDCTLRDSAALDSSFASAVVFTPPEFSVPRGDMIPIGALAGGASTQVTLGLLNNPCRNVVTSGYTLMNASVDTDHPIAGRDPLAQDPLAPLALDEDPANGIPDGADRFPAHLADVLEAQPRARLFGAAKLAAMWVTIDVLIFDPGAALPGPDGPLLPDPSLGYPSIVVESNPRFSGVQSSFSDVCSSLITTTVAYGLTLDNPCTPVLPAGTANCPGQPFIQGLGYPLLPCETANTVDEDGDGAVNDGCLQRGPAAESGPQCANATNDDQDDGLANDGCPQVGPESEGGVIADPDGCDADTQEASCVQRRNPPAAGTYEFTTFAASLRDADGDGIENELDVCALIANQGWDPRTSDEDDPDADGLPATCDPQPQRSSPASSQACPRGFTGPDEDADCLANRQDNCPLDNQLQDPESAPDFSNPPVATDSDGDGIGDACDVAAGGDPLFGNSANGPQVPDGAFAAVCAKMPVEIRSRASTATVAPEFVEDPACASAPAPGPKDGPTPTPAPTPTAVLDVVELPRAGARAGGSTARAPIVAVAGLAVASGLAMLACAWRLRARGR